MVVAGLCSAVHHGRTMKILLFCLLALSASLCSAQTPAATPTQAPAPAAVATPAIEKGAKVFITPMDGDFATYLSAAFLNKKVPLQIVDDASKADYVITGGSQVEKAGWAKTIFISPLPHATASITMKDAHGVLVFAYSVDKTNARKGSQSTAEACAKHLKETIEKPTK
jgi:hypothetical protein